MIISKIRKDIVHEAKEWLGTKWQHQACVKGVAVDCAMLIAGVAKNVGLVSDTDLKKIPPYPKDWHFHQDVAMLPEVMESFGCKKRNVKYPHYGDILVFKIGRCDSHLGIMIEDNVFIHSYSGGNNQVVSNRLNGGWVDRLTSVYRFPGVK